MSSRDKSEYGVTAHSVLDNTNADPDTRIKWVQLSRRLGVPIRCIYFTAPTRLCVHNDTVRALNTGLLNPEKRTILPHTAFSAYASRFVEPRLEEGFQDITRIEFQVRSKLLHRHDMLDTKAFGLSFMVTTSTARSGASTGYELPFTGHFVYAYRNEQLHAS